MELLNWNLCFALGGTFNEVAIFGIMEKYREKYNWKAQKEQLLEATEETWKNKMSDVKDLNLCHKMKEKINSSVENRSAKTPKQRPCREEKEIGK